ncbi:CLAVATA3/ESR (CLE)-related protein 16 [Raphanus sativus]|uniref:CLAVATA3/ESR (CLE)-related protein 16 n=1 Tax=Raphanus sativus TaxID=3726 RepID=A0A6J0JLJ4_RAPSA|nr:CLAVATA3/ESR (CLE)-related protein 16 [Raphanus sativus]KAJ4888492.1 CLAVATA3/ESR (CLE)-related protein 16 [Raphanus sativus]
MGNSLENEHVTKRRRRRRAAPSTMLLWGILFFAQFGLSSSSVLFPGQHHHQSYRSSRKAGLFHERSSLQHPSNSVSFTGPPREEENRDDVYKDDKRLVHTGPNPLHN